MRLNKNSYKLVITVATIIIIVLITLLVIWLRSNKGTPILQQAIKSLSSSTTSSTSMGSSSGQATIRSGEIGDFILSPVAINTNNIIYYQEDKSLWGNIVSRNINSNKSQTLAHNIYNPDKIYWSPDRSNALLKITYNHLLREIDSAFPLVNASDGDIIWILLSSIGKENKLQALTVNASDPEALDANNIFWLNDREFYYYDATQQQIRLFDIQNNSSRAIFNNTKDIVYIAASANTLWLGSAEEGKNSTLSAFDLQGGKRIFSQSVANFWITNDASKVVLQTPDNPAQYQFLDGRGNLKKTLTLMELAINQAAISPNYFYYYNQTDKTISCIDLNDYKTDNIPLPQNQQVSSLISSTDDMLIYIIDNILYYINR